MCVGTAAAAVADIAGVGCLNCLFLFGLTDQPTVSVSVCTSDLVVEQARALISLSSSLIRNENTHGIGIFSNLPNFQLGSNAAVRDSARGRWVE